MPHDTALLTSDADGALLARRSVLRGALALGGAAGAAPLLGPAGDWAASATTEMSTAGLQWTPDRLLPRFRRARHLLHSDVGTADPWDRLLLTTLQGVVNRREPRIHLVVDPVDATWLAEMPLRRTHVVDPLALLDRFRDEVRGAVVLDPEVPDTVNLATTLAGLTAAVVAHPDQVRRLGLPVVDDLRGRFADDPLEIYSWQLEHLFPRCTHRLLVGLPPVISQATPGVDWRELARESERVRDSSNRARHTFDLSDEVAAGTGEVFVRFRDSFTDDGWGASVRGVRVTDETGEVVSFEPGTEAEAAFLVADSGSAVGGEGNRFADGGASFSYRFEPRPGTATLTVSVEMWNQYRVDATATAPSRLVPFTSFRDYAVATRAMVTWLPPAGATGELLTRCFDAVPPATPYAGWFSDDVQGEWSGVDLASQHAVEVLPADHLANGTVHAGVAARISRRVRRERSVRLRDKVYLTLTVGEGDNLQYCQRRMRDLWDHPARGEVPTNWTVSPVLRDIGPALLAHYQRTATPHDLLVCGPSGAGYTYPGSWPRRTVGRYLDVSGAYLRATGMDLVYAYERRDDDGSGWLPMSPEVVTAYAERTPVRGIIQSWETGDLLESHAGVPLIGNLYPVGGPAAYRAGLLAHVAAAGERAGPLFIAGAVNAWSWDPGDVADLVRQLDDRFEVVLADTFFTLLGHALEERA